MNLQTETGTIVPIEACCVSTRHCREIEVETLAGWKRMTGWVTYRGEIDLKFTDDTRLRGIARVSRVAARSTTLLCHGDHWCTTRGDWA